MRSDFVMTEGHCKHKLPVADPIGMGAYTLDSHNTQRIVHNGMIKNEGDIQSYIGGKAYGISYRALVPPAAESENLLMPWALSATHISFGSIRMEPVFMVLGLSTAEEPSQAPLSSASEDFIKLQHLPPFHAAASRDGSRSDYMESAKQWMDSIRHEWAARARPTAPEAGAPPNPTAWFRLRLGET